MAAVRDRVDQVTRSPVFVNSSGRRRRWVTWALGAVAVVCIGYLLLLGFSLTGGPLTPQDLLPLVDPPGTSQPQRVGTGDRAPAGEARTPAPRYGTATAGTPATAGTGAVPSGVPGQPTGSAAPSAGEPPAGEPAASEPAASEPAASEPAASEPAEDPPGVTLPPLPTPSIALPSVAISVGVGVGGGG